MKYHKVDNFVVKLRAYPNASQRKMIDEILHGLRVAYNVTAYEISKGNELVTQADKNDSSVRWPDFYACTKKSPNPAHSPQIIISIFYFESN